MTARLAARGVTRAIEGHRLVDDVDLDVEAGAVTAIIGPNGAGKTTLFDLLAGATHPDVGRILLDGVDVTDHPSDRRTRAGLARTFQQSTVFPTLTVEENLRVGAENRRRDGLVRGLLGLADRHAGEARWTTERVLDELGLRGVRHQPGGRLSTGTLRLVELGRALCTEPVVLLLDEPASGLDDDETEELHQVLHRLAGGGLALLLVEHDLDLVTDAADVVHVMATGRIVASGPPHEVMARPDVRAITLGVTEADVTGADVTGADVTGADVSGAG